MNKIYNSIIILLFFSLSMLAQINLPVNLDSLRIEQKFNFLLNSELELKAPLHSLGEIVDPYELGFETEILDYTDGNLSHLNSMAMKRIQDNMSHSFATFRKGQNKYHLGVVSDVLGYIGTAAAAGLAVYHVSKYKKKYGIK